MKIETKLLVIADDFTGAMDTAVQFTKLGIETLVYRKLEIVSFLEAEVVVVNINSRHLSKEEAYSLVARLTKKAVQNGVEYFYKKTDSALRGHIGSELSAMLNESGSGTMFFVPSYPKMNRITVGGTQYIGVTKVSESAFKDDPFNPVTESYIPKIIGQETDEKVYITHARESLNLTSGIVVVDSITEEDLMFTADKLKALDAKVFAGCAGFAEFLPMIIKFSTVRSKKYIKRSKSLIPITASVNPITLAQLKYAKKEGFEVFTLSKSQKMHKEYFSTLYFHKTVEKIYEKFKADEPVALASVMKATDYITPEGYDLKAVAEQLAGNMALIARQLLWYSTAALFIIGGDLLEALFDVLKSTTIIPKNEILPGVVEFEIIVKGKRKTIISKSGGFGNEDCIVEVFNRYARKK